jgi:hypothetical protein
MEAGDFQYLAGQPGQVPSSALGHAVHFRLKHFLTRVLVLTHARNEEVSELLRTKEERLRSSADLYNDAVDQLFKKLDSAYSFGRVDKNYRAHIEKQNGELQAHWHAKRSELNAKFEAAVKAKDAAFHGRLHEEKTATKTYLEVSLTSKFKQAAELSVILPALEKIIDACSEKIEKQPHAIQDAAHECLGRVEELIHSHKL